MTSTIVAGPGQPTGAIALPLCPPSAISGTVVDDAGEPVEQAQVQLFTSTVVHGLRRVTTLAVRRSADNGDFRFGSLPPGAYYLAVSGSPWYTKYAETQGDSAPRSMTHVGYRIQYNSNVSDPASAEPLTLTAGQESTAKFVLLPVPASAVHVHIEGQEDLTKRFTLTAAGLQGTRVVVSQGTESGDSHSFWGIPTGHYQLRVDASDASRAWYAEAEFDAGETDTDISATLREAPSLSGTLAVDRGGKLPANLSVVLIPTEGGVSRQLPAGGDGHFSMPAIPPQRFRVALSGDDAYYLKRWTVEGARRESSNTVDLRQTSAVRLNVLAARGTGRVEGKTHLDGGSLPTALVVLAPAEASAPQENYRAVPCDSDGSYEFRGVPPGTYLLFAAMDGAGLEYANRTAIQSYLDSAQRILIGPGEVVKSEIP